jgi:O-antigen ligase
MKVVINKYYILTILLAIYSLLPAISKISGSPILYTFYIPILLLSYYVFRKSKLKLTSADIPFLIMFFIIILYIPVSLFILHTASYTSILYGSIMFLIPMTGYFLSRIIPLNIFIKSVIIIGGMHSMLAILFYGFFPLPSFLTSIAYTITEGTMAFRMSSVSGSLGLAALMSVAFSFAMTRLFFIKSKSIIILALIFCIVIIMTMQRSAWLGASLSIILLLYYTLRNRNIIKSNVYIFLILLLFGVIGLGSLIDLNTLDFLIERLDSLVQGDAVSERSATWTGGINNFFNIPSGVGIGTLGQAARVGGLPSEYNRVLDGDYFRILSELGLVALVFYFVLFFRLFFRLFKVRKIAPDELAIYLALIVLSVNMLGSNTTEFYFINFIYWVCVGFLFQTHTKRAPV